MELLGFSYSNCGGANSLVNITSLSVKPDPLKFPGPITVATNFQIKEELSQPLKVKMQLLPVIV